MQEAMRTYLELAMGLTETSRKKVRKVVKDVVKDAVGRSGATAEQVKALTGDLVAVNSANREALAKLVRFEVDRALGIVGLATAEEVGELTQQVRDLKDQLREARAATPDGARTTERTTAKVTRSKAAPAKATAKAIAAREAAASRTPAKRTAAAKKAPAKATTARTTAPATKAVANKAVARKSVAKKAPAKKAVARKAGPA